MFTSLTTYIFIVLSLVTILSALFVILSRNPVKSLLSLIITFFSISGHYVLMNAQFLAIINIIVYSGAIMVLFLFLLMLMNLNKETDVKNKVNFKLLGILIGCLFMVLVVFILLQSKFNNEKVGLYNGDIGLVKNLGNQLFKKFVLPFELTSLLFLTAIIGSVLLSRKPIANK